MKKSVIFKTAQLILLSILIFELSFCLDDPEPLVVGSNHWIGYKTLNLADRLGYLEKGKIHLVELPSSSNVIRYFKNDQIDAAALTLDEVLRLESQKEDIVIILVFDTSNGGDALIANKKIISVRELKGKKIAVEKTGVGAYFLSRALEENKLKKQDVILVSAEFSEHESIFTSGKVDAVVTFEPIKSLLEQKGGHVLFDSSSIPDEIVDVLVVKRNILEKKKNKIKLLLEGYFKALSYQKEEANRADSILAKIMNIDMDTLKKLQKGISIPDKEKNKILLNPENENFRLKIEKLYNGLIQEGFLSKESSGRISIKTKVMF